MNTLEAIASRRSIRSYNDIKVESETLDKILKSIYAAPVAGGKYKAMAITVVQKDEIIDEISKTLKSEMNFPVDPLYGASTMMILSGDESILDDNALFANAGVMLENAQLAASELGLGSCIIWGTGFAMNSNEKLMKSLNFNEGFKPLAGIVFGYSNQEITERTERVTFETTYI